jgi:uncharacterized membrane protein (DUF2068 family)
MMPLPFIAQSHYIPIAFQELSEGYFLFSISVTLSIAVGVVVYYFKVAKRKGVPQI